MKQNIYDNEKFFNEYNEMRNNSSGKNANDLIEMPTLWALLPNLKNKQVLDLGCGIGNNCKKCVELEASYILGIDISNKMIDLAKKQTNNCNIEYKVLAMEEISAIDKKFDVVMSSLVMHYILDFDKLCKDVYNLLNKEGYFIFSQEHPIGTGTIFNIIREEKEKFYINDKLYYLISDYNRNGERKRQWIVDDVIKYHRNFSSIINSLINAKFKIVEIVEPTPNDETLKIMPKYSNQFDRPYFLFIKVRK